MMGWKDPEVGGIWLGHGVGFTVGADVSGAGEEIDVGWGVVAAGIHSRIIGHF